MTKKKSEKKESPIKLEGSHFGSTITPNREEYHNFPTFLKAFLRHFQRYTLTGLLVWVPLLVTAWVSWWFISKVGGGVNTFMKGRVDNLHELADRLPYLGFLQQIHYSPWMGFLIALFLFLTTGFLARYIVGRKLIASLEQFVANIPFINRIYLAVQQIRDVVIGRNGAVFQEVVVLEYPRPGVMVVGFVTSREQGIVQKSTGRDLVAVFVPTTPNPTSGFLLYLPPEELTPMALNVEEAMKLIVSAGAFIPGNESPEDAIAKLSQNAER